MRRWGVLGLVVVMAAGVAGCDPKRPAPLPVVGEKRIAQETADCAKRGGELLQFGGLSLCRTQPADGGKACRTKADCEGACLARSMTCAPVSPLRGCNEVVTSDGVRVTECVD